MNKFKESKLIRLLIRYEATFIFEDKRSNMSYKFKINKRGAKLIRKMTHKKHNQYFVMSNTEEYFLFDSKEDVEYFLASKNVEYGEVYFKDKPYVMFTKNDILKHLDIIATRNDLLTIDNKQMDHLNNQSKKRTKRIQVQTGKEKHKRKFDWHEEFLEGKRIGLTFEESEGYADEMKKQYDK